MQWDSGGTMQWSRACWVRKREGFLNREKYEQVKYRSFTKIKKYKRDPNFIFKKVTLPKKSGKLPNFLTQTPELFKGIYVIFQMSINV